MGITGLIMFQQPGATRVTNKWKESRAVSVSRFLIFTRAVPMRKDQAEEHA